MPQFLRRLGEFTQASDSEFADDAEYNVKKQAGIGLGIATGTDKDTANATYSLMPSDVAENVTGWASIILPAEKQAGKTSSPKPSTVSPLPFIISGVVALGGILWLWRWR